MLICWIGNEVRNAVYNMVKEHMVVCQKKMR